MESALAEITGEFHRSHHKDTLLTVFNFKLQHKSLQILEASKSHGFSNCCRSSQLSFPNPRRSLHLQEASRPCHRHHRHRRRHRQHPLHRRASVPQNQHLQPPYPTLHLTRCRPPPRDDSEPQRQGMLARLQVNNRRSSQRLVFSNEDEVVERWRENPATSFHRWTKWRARFNHSSLEIDGQSVTKILHHLRPQLHFSSDESYVQASSDLCRQKEVSFDDLSC